MTTATYRFFDVRVKALAELGPSFLRVTFTAADLHEFADGGADQRIKVILPLTESGFTHLPRGADWYTAWQALPSGAQNPLRTYTVRAVRPAQREVDIDFVRHGDSGPASAWAGRATVGDEVVLIGPNALAEGPFGGTAWNPPPRLQRVLLVGDETAVPAISVICAALDDRVSGEVVLEVPHAADRQPIQAPAGVRVTWLAREGSARGSMTLHTVSQVAAGVFGRRALVTAGAGSSTREPSLPDVDVDSQLLWEVPEGTGDGPGCYAWLAGEAGLIKVLRRHLVRDLAVDRRSVAFMGYWREGRSESG